MTSVIRKVTARGVLLTGSALAGVSLFAHLLIKGDTADTATMIGFIAGAAVGAVGLLAGGADPKPGARR